MKIIIFGTSCFADLLTYYINKKSNNEVIAYTINKQYISSDTTQNGKIPIVPFEEIENLYKQQEVNILPAIGYSRMQLRSSIFNAIKNKGYKIPNIICNDSIVDENSKLGEGNIIMPGCIIEPFSTIGDNNIFWSGSQICHNAVIEGHSFFAAKSLIGGRTFIGHSTFIGFNTTIIHDLQIGKNNVIGAGSFVNKSTQENSKYYGVPAKFREKMPPEGWYIK